MKRFNFFKYTTLGNKVHTTYFNYWFFKHLTQGGEPVTPAVEGEGTEFTLSPTSNKKLAVVSLKGDTTQTGEPTPDNPQDVNVVTGTQTLTITNGEDIQTYPITLGSVELCKIGTYQDYIYKSGDKWYVKKETASVPVKDNIYWSINNNCFQGTTYAGKKSDTICICTHFTFNPIRSGITSNLKDGEFGFNTSEIPTFKYTTITTTTDWNTWLSTNNPIVYYILTTPTDTEITDTTLIADLNTLLSSGYLKKGTNTIKTTSTGTNLPTIIYIKTN